MAGHHEPRPEHEMQDTEKWVFFETLFGEPVEWHLPKINLGFTEFQLTKFMILELIAAAIILLIFIPLARRVRSGELPKGRWWNFFEAMLTFVRDQIARPNLDSHDDHGHGEAAHGEPGHHHDKPEHHEGDRYVPILWTIFLFILVCNLLGMIPMAGSPTASIFVTMALALISFVMMHAAAIAKVGPVKYFKSLWPSVDMPPGGHFKLMGVGFTLMIGAIEIMGTFIKGGVLAFRLFANMFAGHLVLAYIIFFIYAVHKSSGYGLLWGGVTLASVFGVVALSFLELFVACLQAYIFTYLTALFMGMGLHHAQQQH